MMTNFHVPKSPKSTVVHNFSNLQLMNGGTTTRREEQIWTDKSLRISAASAILSIWNRETMPPQMNT